ncbi:MAG: hypothetical protein ABI747_01520 [Candidatus Moraniibacteriota bacterium]
MTRSRKISLLVAFFLPLFFLIGRAIWHDPHSFAFPGIQKVHAEDFDDLYEKDDDEDEKGYPVPTPSSKEKKKSSKPIIKNIIEYRPVTKTVSVIEPAFTTDTDSDGLVDGMDPDPQIDQHQYFTDDDSDGMPNVWDQYPNEDDFSYLDEASDVNHNGLIDMYE